MIELLVKLCMIVHDVCHRFRPKFPHMFGFPTKWKAVKKLNDAFSLNVYCFPYHRRFRTVPHRPIHIMSIPQTKYICVQFHSAVVAQTLHHVRPTVLDRPSTFHFRFHNSMPPSICAPLTWSCMIPYHPKSTKKKRLLVSSHTSLLFCFKPFVL